MPKLKKRIGIDLHQLGLKRTVLRIGDYYTDVVVSYSGEAPTLCIPAGPYIIVTGCGELKPDIGQKITCRITSVERTYYMAKFVCCTV